MKLFLSAIAIAVATVAASQAGADVGVSVSLGQPGFYGQIDLGNVGPPPVVYARPVTIVQGPRGVVVDPLYLHVPSEHARHWRRYCGQYGACNRPVYFVKDDWYNRVYVPHYRDEHRDARRDDNDHHEHEGHHDGDDHRDNH